MKDEKRAGSEPESVQCNECARAETADDSWWCRDCAMTLCGNCNLVKGHTEHTSGPWKKRDVVVACAQALEARCSLRSKYAADEEITVKEFVAEVETKLVDKVHRKLEWLNERDRLKIAMLSGELGLDSSDTNLYHVPSPGGPAWKCASDQQRIDRLLAECARVTNLPKLLADGGALNAKSLAVLPDDPDPDQLLRFMDRADTSVDTSADDGFHSNGETSRHNGESTPLDQTDCERFRFPLEPQVRVANFDWSATSPVTSETRATPSPLMDRISFSGRVPDTPSTRSSMQLNADDSSSTAAGRTLSRLSSSTQTDQPSRTPTPHVLTDNSWADDASGSSDSNRIGILSFHFGSEFFSRPIDVCALPDGHLAVSDSCGGVFITTRKGDVVHQLGVDSGSASALCHDPERNQLLVSAMHRHGRTVYVFDVDAKYKQLATIPCPSDPRIDLSRTRWITCNSRGQLYMASGDNKRSVVWTYHRLLEQWTVLKEQKNTRYQYLFVAEERPDQDSVVLLVAEALHGAILLLVVGKNGQIWSELNLNKQYKLHDYVRSPASAVVDSAGNLLILDYANGKLWGLLRAQEGVRRLRVLTDLGAQQALGMAVVDGWCYVACYNKKRVQAIKYLESE